MPERSVVLAEFGSSAELARWQVFFGGTKKADFFGSLINKSM